MLRVLVVDDNIDSLAMMKALLAGWGHDTRIATTGAEAQRVAYEFHPRVVLLDLALPDRHGYEVAKLMRKDAGQRSMHFVVITGWSHLADQLLSSAAGISHHLIKPPNLPLLKGILDDYAAQENAAEVH